MRKHALTHTQKLSNWLGEEHLQHIVEGSRGMYVPVPIANVPGRLFSYDGEIYGTIQGGTGFSSLDDMIAEATANGKMQHIFFTKVSTLNVNNSWASLWNVGPDPAAGGTPAARPGGAVPDNTTTGSFRQTDPAGSDTLHQTTAFGQGTAGPNTLLMYDRLFHASAINHNTTAGQTVTGVPTRYLLTAAKGNFMFLEVTTVLGATAHNVTVTYVDQDGNAAEAAAAIAVVVSSAVTRIPLAFRFIPLNSGDTGVRNVTNIAFSAASTGVSNIVIGRPLGWIACSQAGVMALMDGINSMFNVAEYKAGACLAFLERKGVGAATTYDGSVICLSG